MFVDKKDGDVGHGLGAEAHHQRSGLDSYVW